ncbi:MAG TPA: FAD-dependent oxidoreductase [Candidatus Dormibacteraeota bacterium]|nr:FAD-dependent oxidoreductase [Candidatus Dormibacteraeota bacterium]
MHADLLVLGGGMAGLAAAARAVEAGARVVVAEKRPQVGGSASLSAGILWTAPDVETVRRVCPGGDPELGRALVEGFAPAVEWIRSTGVFVSERWEGQMGFGTAVRVDVGALLDRWRRRVERAGALLCRRAARELLTDAGGRVRGAVLDGPLEVEAGAVLLATGGFQGDPELRAVHLGPAARDVLVRSSAGSVGDGFRMGRAVGAAASACLDGFYGHLVPSPLRGWSEADFLPLTQYHSSRAVLVNRLGRRFTDESLGDEVSNQAVLRQPGVRAVLCFDHGVRTRWAAAAPYPHGQVVDRAAAAEASGGRFVRAGSPAELIDAVVSWGVARGPLAGSLAPLGAPPLYAVEVQPTITFPFGGLAVDADGRVLGQGGVPVPGLFAAGADAGGLQDRRYVGGLALGAVFGPRAAEAALQIGVGGTR